MSDLLEGKDKIYRNLAGIKRLKFKENMTQEASYRLSEEEKNLIKKYKFYQKYIRIGGKINGENGHPVDFVLPCIRRDDVAGDADFQQRL